MLEVLHENYVEAFFLMSGNSENNQLNGNGPNASLKGCYDEEKNKGDENAQVFHVNLIM